MIEWASELVELVEKDTQARKKRDQQYEEGLRRTGLGDDAPGGAEFEELLVSFTRSWQRPA